MFDESFCLALWISLPSYWPSCVPTLSPMNIWRTSPMSWSVYLYDPTFCFRFLHITSSCVPQRLLFEGYSLCETRSHLRCWFFYVNVSVSELKGWAETVAQDRRLNSSLQCKTFPENRKSNKWQFVTVSVKNKKTHRGLHTSGPNTTTSTLPAWSGSLYPLRSGKIIKSCSRNKHTGQRVT